MAKKKRNKTSVPKPFSSDPFSALKGFSVSEEQQQQQPQDAPAQVPVAPIYGLFEDEMKLLGVERLDNESADDGEDRGPAGSFAPAEEAAVVETDNDLFLKSVGEMNIRFEDSYPEEEEPASAEPRRMRQLRKGRIVPDLSLDLHGLQGHEVTARLKSFIANARYQQARVLLVITGKGLHSEAGKTVLRDEVERFLTHEGKKLVTEWGRAPRQYGGEGAIVLFLRQ